MMWLLALLPFTFQAIVIGVDEVYFHVRRGLPKWEKIGHPIDTLSVLNCMIFALMVPFTPGSLKIYLVLAVLSCLMVTKDEFIHKHFCPASENWLHALLFTLHPITLTMVGLIWAFLGGADLPSWIAVLFDNKIALKTFLYLQTFAMTAFLFYQIIFWKFIWKEKIAIKH